MTILFQGIFITGLILYLSGMVPLYYKMYRHYGLYELFNILVLFKFLNQHSKEAKSYMLIAAMGIVFVIVSAMWLQV